MKSVEVGVRTEERYEFVPITDEVKRVVEESGVREGLCVVASTHTTAGITINEDYDPDVRRDLRAASRALVNALDVSFEHAEGNSDSHLLTSLFGPSQTLTVRDGRLDLGRWQGVYLCEFDGPRSRTVRVSIIEG
ncbi:secondary thiamine-phosphate synthase enzyme [Rubrobacter radiotolerans]|uniref:Secondary thiamine-phosphate synthase enzyme n=1 Tax=Rubrobacter radiotolerans TaxID=42256 RepID=A0A023X281_RUBRA|nr:secondary thiamine-phosphate synthase enzyme YjbQ [Rubrobacter radiotolerans]AHY46463.1 secondary thiamine-phosphate synthase enzyme [Rubrobacter radiotolerans]MDX5893870.1 secondary thiamine-phosphate synthase enzyme YjbQ [Rubrobacter radiotolerans]SMC04661.1 secondary thiamine-phosphate synthase enzyme [Rubrobacter radiotolerans DSM 5868]